MLSKLGAGRSVTALKNQINDLKKEIASMKKPKKMPELIESTNLVRINEYLEKSDSLKTQLLDLYDQYAGSLEDLLSAVFDIQIELKDIIKEEAKTLSTEKKMTRKTKQTKRGTLKFPKKSTKKTKRRK